MTMTTTTTTTTTTTNERPLARARRTAIATAATLAATAIFAPAAALARGGSGSFGFGGGSRGFGGGGGGFGRGFGRGHFFFIPLGGGGGGILFLILIVIIVLFVLPRLRAFMRGQQTSGRAPRSRVAARQRRTELAAAEAAEDDPAFAPDVVKPAAAQLFLAIQAAWDAGDRRRLGQLLGGDLYAEWERRLDDFKRRGWRNHVQPLGEPSVGYVGLTNAKDDRDDRVVVLIEARLRDYVVNRWGQVMRRSDSVSDVSAVREYWTLGKRGEHWILLSIEQGAEGAHQLDEPLIPSPWSNERALRDEALLEGAVAEAVPAGTDIAGLADLDFQGDARAAANDLSLADGRFAPDVLEVAARRAVAAWAEAVDGDDRALDAIATPPAKQQLLHPGDPSERTRLVIRGPKVSRIRITGLDAAAHPPTMSISVEIEGRRYIEDRSTSEILAGSQTQASRFSEDWTLTLDGPAEQPWRIARVHAPVGRL